MKNYWLDQKKTKWAQYHVPFDFESKEEYRGINLLTKNGHTIEMIDEPIDLLHTMQHNSRYKEYERPPFDTNNYQGFDIDAPTEEIETTYPKIYGFKTPQKHAFTFTDAEPACEKRWKRIEIRFSFGTSFIMKDDSKPCGEWRQA